MSEASPVARLVEGIARRAWTSLALLLAAVAGAFVAYGARVDWDPSEPPVDNRPELWFVEDDPALVAYHEYQDAFGTDEDIIVALPLGEGVFTPAALTLVGELSERLREVPGVRGVASLRTVLYSGTVERGGAEVLVVEPMFEGPVETGAEAARIRARVRESPLYWQDLVAPDEEATVLNVRLEPSDGSVRHRREVQAGVRAVLEATLAEAGRPPDAWHWGGVGVIEVALDALSQSESNRFFALGALVMAVLLYAFLRRVLAVVVALGGVYLAILLMIGVYLGCGFKLNFITSALPVLVLVIGLTDCVYFITTYYQEREALEASGLTKRQVVGRAVASCFEPSLFNSIAASAGFLSFCAASMPALRWFGAFAAVGIMAAFASSVVCCTVAFDRFDLRRPWPADAPASGRRLFGAIAAFVLRRRLAVLAGALLLLGVGLLGISRLRVDNDTIAYFYPDHPVARDHRAILEHFGPYVPLDVLVDTSELNGVMDPAVLRAMAALQERALARERARARAEGGPPRIGSAVALDGVVEQLAYAFVGGPEARRIPDSQAAVEQLLLFYDPTRPDEPLMLVDAPWYRLGRITFRTGTVSAREGGEVLAAIMRDARDLFPEGVRVQPTGLAALYVKQTEYIYEGQVRSLSLTFLIVFGLIGVVMRSPVYALVSIPANVTPVLTTLAFMGFAGIRLDSAALLIGSISLAIAVDDTIHFLHRFRTIYARTGDLEASVAGTVRSIGLAMLSTSVIVAVGFGVIALADMWSMAVFGMLTAVTMLTTLLCELLLTPSVLLVFGRFLPRPAGPDGEDRGPAPQA